jgi:uncharacterized protein YkwD
MIRDVFVLRQYIERVTELVNVERAKVGLAALKSAELLNMAAAVRAEELERSFSHSRPDGRSGFTVLAEFNIVYTACAENLALGHETPGQVVAAWMDSRSHRANILNPRYNYIGVGIYRDASGRPYWAQVFTD